MKILLAITWASPFLLLSYLLGRAATSARQKLRELLGLGGFTLLALLLASGFRNIITLSAMAAGASAGAVDWMLLIWLLLAAVTLYVLGDDHQTTDRRVLQLKFGKWLSISISAIALALVSVLLTSLLIQVVEMLPRPRSDNKGQSWVAADWWRSAIGRLTASSATPLKAQGAQEAQTPAEFRAKLRKQRAQHRREINKYLSSKKRPPAPRPVMEEKVDPQRFNGWQLEPGSLVPGEVSGLITRSSVSVAENMYEAVYAPTLAISSTDGEGDAPVDSMQVTLVVAKQDSPKLADEYLQPILNQYSFGADTAVLESKAVRFGFLGGYNGKRAVYQQAFIGWTTGLFSFAVVARTSGYVVTDRALLYGPAFQAAVATLRSAEPAIASSKPAH